MSARSAGRFLERLLTDPEFGVELLDATRTRRSWADALREEGYTCSISELRELAGPTGGEQLAPEQWLEALVRAAAS
jgi:hypothetical protein